MMNKMNNLNNKVLKGAVRTLFCALFVSLLPGCSEESKEAQEPPVGPATGIGAEIERAILPYDGQMADDASKDKPSQNTDFYWEASEFPNKVTIEYDGATAKVTNTNPAVRIHTDGANVTVDATTGNVSGVEIIARGESEDGQLKIYGLARTLLTLDGLRLRSQRGPAINCQDKKRLMINVNKDTDNRIEDASEYLPDLFYLPGSGVDTEDRKGCLFSEGHIILSGTGRLTVRGRYRHGVVTDGYFYMRPGVTLVIEDAARNALHAKGDATDGYGIVIAGGYLYANTSGAAGRAIRCDMDVTVSGGTLSLNSSGDAIFDETDGDLSSGAGIKAGGKVNILGGDISVKATGRGGKGINATGNIYLTGGKVTVAVSGGESVDEQRGLSSSPKGVKSDGKVMVTGGENRIYATDDAVSALNMSVSGGQTWIFSDDKDGVDVEQDFTISRGTLITSADGGNAAGLDAPQISIDGGTLVCTGGGASLPTGARQGWVSTRLKKVKAGEPIALSGNRQSLMCYLIPRDMDSMDLLFSAEGLQPGADVELMTGGSVPHYGSVWNGLFSAGSTYSDALSAVTLKAQ